MESNKPHKKQNHNTRPFPHLSAEMALLITIIDSSSKQDKKIKLDCFSFEKLDWLFFLKLAQKHHLTAFIGRKLNEHKIDIVPSAIKSALSTQTRQNDDRCEILVNELLSLITILQNEGIEVVAFKGPSLAVKLYGDVKTRFSRDIDILLKRKDMERALSIMENAGYIFDKVRRTPKLEQAYLNYNGQYLLFSPKNKIAVEPHSALGPSLMSLDIDYDELFNQTTSIKINNQDVKIFKPEALLIVLCLHGTKENWRRLKWILDIAQLLNQNTNLDFDYVIRQSGKWGLRRSTLLGLKLSNDIFNSNLPDNIQKMISEERFIEHLGNKITNCIEDPKAKEEESYNISLDYLLSRERGSDKLRYIYRIIFTPRDLHFGIIQLPDRLFFLYPSIKIIHDYLLLPPWLLLKKIFGVKSKPRCAD